MKIKSRQKFEFSAEALYTKCWIQSRRSRSI